MDGNNNTTSNVKRINKTKVNPDTGLTNKEELFCMYYVKYLNNGRAAYQAINPRCKDSSAMVKSSQMLRNDKVQTYIHTLIEQLKKNTKISLEQMIQAQQDIYVDSVKQINIYDIKGQETGQTKMADAKAANDALKNMGKWLGYENQNQNLNVSVDDSMKEYYSNLSKRLRGRQVEGVDDDE